jgi:hypothetical protein
MSAASRSPVYRVRLPIILLILFFSLVFIPSTSVAAQTFNPGCSVANLVANVATAGSNAQADTINLAAGCTYTLTATLTINADAGNLLTINGNGATLNGNSSVRVLYVNSGANVSINNVTIANGNIVSAIGGGLYNSGTLTLTTSTISGNTADYGGGIGSDGTLTLTASTISGNTAQYAGGIRNYGTMMLINSTVSGNSATTNGGGILDSGTLTIANSTISGNSAVSYGGLFSNGLATTVRNSIVANSISGGDCNYAANQPTISFSLIEDGSCGVVNGVGGNRTGDPGLLTQTGSPAFFPLSASSVAFNAGDNSLIPIGVTTDQRGSPRISGGIVDMGSFERLIPPTNTPTITPSFTPSPHPSLTPPAPDTNLITNGTFDAGTNGWTFSSSTQQVNGGVLTVAPTSAGGGFYQQVNFNSAGSTYQVNFRAANTSATVKTVNIIVRDTDYNPSYNCVFVLPAFAPFQNYRMRFTTSPNAFIPMTVQFALSGDAAMGVQFDDITMTRRTNLLVSATECVTAPPANTNLVYDGGFNQGTANWAAFNATMNTVNIGGANGSITQIGRNSGTPSGGFYQFNPYSAPANGVLQFDFQMGNQSSQSRVINMLVRNTDWTDLHSCFINLPPNTPLTNFQIMLKTSVAWANIVIQGWIQVGDYVSGTPPFMFDNLSIQYLPTSGFAGSTQCPVVPSMPQHPTLTPSPPAPLPEGEGSATPSLTATVTATATTTLTETALPSATATASETPTLTPEPPTVAPLPTDTATAEPPTAIPTAEPPTAEPAIPEPSPEVTQSP